MVLGTVGRGYCKRNYGLRISGQNFLLGCLSASKTQLLLSTNSHSSEKISGEAVWKKQGFFSDERDDVNLEKRSFPENTLYYINQGYISTIKEGG